MVNEVLLASGTILAGISLALFGITFQVDIREPFNPLTYSFLFLFSIGVFMVAIGWGLP